jgi:hypothetical protein
MLAGRRLPLHYRGYPTSTGSGSRPVTKGDLLLASIAEWLARDPRLAQSLGDFVGHPAYGIPQLREDLGRFTFLLGGSDGEQWWSPNSS